jgi:TrmH family RNA methyltransferase
MAATVGTITARDNPLLVRLRRLAAQPDAYRRAGRVLLEGEHLCAAWSERRGGAGVHAVVTRAAWERSAIRALAVSAEQVSVVDEKLLATAGSLDSAAPIAFIAPWPGAGSVVPGTAAVVLDRLQDAGNVGTILRSAAALGAAQVVALKGTAALWSPKVLRAGMGAHLALHLVEGADLEALEALGVPLVAASAHAEAELPEAELPWPCAWVLGHEGQGLDEALEARCDLRVRIPQPGGEESLNVATAAAICLYESARQRRAGESAPRPATPGAPKRGRS